MAESIIHKQLVLGELLDLQSFTNVCRTFVDLYKVGLKVFDANGTKLVDMKVASGDFCAYMFTGPNGRRLCTETVTHIKVRPLDAPNAQPAIAVRNCFSGLRYLMMPVLYEGDLLGRIIFGPFMPEELGDLGAGALHQDAKLWKVVQGQDQNMGFWEPLMNRARRLQSVQVWHGHIHDHDVGVQFPGFGNGFISIAGFAANSPACLGFEQRSNRSTNVGLVVDNQNAKLLFSVSHNGDP